MKLITTGCSFAGHASTLPYDEQESWTYWLERLVKPNEVIELGLNGIALDYIYRSVVDSVIDNLHDDLIVVVGWTSIQRWENLRMSLESLMVVHQPHIKGHHNIT